MNGDTSEFISNSLVSFQDMVTSYGFMVYDLSKDPTRVNVSSNVPVNISLLATNQSQVSIDIIAFCETDTTIVLESTPTTSYVL